MVTLAAVLGRKLVMVRIYPVLPLDIGNYKGLITFTKTNGNPSTVGLNTHCWSKLTVLTGFLPDLYREPPLGQYLTYLIYLIFQNADINTEIK